MAGKADKKGNGGNIIIRKEEVIEGGGHGGAWKVAYADFVTAMMAFFLLMWLLNATTEEQRKGLADYFSPNNVLSHSSSGMGLPFGGKTAFSTGGMVSDRGAEQVVVGNNPVVEAVPDPDTDALAEPRPNRDDVPSKAPDQGGRLAAKAPPSTRLTAAGVPVSPLASASAASKPGQAKRAPTEAELRAENERHEKQAFEQAAQQIRDAVANDPKLAELAKQMTIDLTPDGLRIQILDADRQAMFALGSADPNERARLLLQKVAPVLAKLPEDISIAGHTDAAPFVGAGRTNWELSADRANATRRLLVDAGLQETRIRSVTGNAERDLLIPSDPLAAANRRISIVVLRSTRSPQPEPSPPAASPP
jgi:chemotaxis protein MotB